MYFCKIAISDGNFEKKVNGNDCRFSRLSDYLTSFGELVSWITSLRSVFLKCLKSNKEKSSVCNAFFFYETHLILGLPHFIRFSSLGFIVDQSIFLLRKMDAFFFFSLPQNFILDS